MKMQIYILTQLQRILLLFALFGHFTLQAQHNQMGIIERSTTINLNAEDRDTIHYLEVKDSVALIRAIKLINSRNYPISIIKKPVLDPFFDLVMQYEAQLDEYRLLDHHQLILDSIQQIKITELKQIINIQEGRVANFKKLSEDLTDINTQLNGQLNQAMAVAKECNKGKVRRQWLTALLGAGVGFSVATIITAFK